MNRRIKLVIFIVGLTLLMSIVVYFTTKHMPVPCDQILDIHLRAVPFNTITSDTMAQWIKENYGLTDEDLKIDEVTNPDSGGRKARQFSWKSGGNRYNSFISSSVTYIRVELSSQPTIDEVVGCFGAPSHYQATDMIYPDRTFIFNLWYLERGVVLEHSVIPGLNNVLDHFLGRAGAVDGNTLIESISVVKPDSAENMISQLYHKTNVGKALLSLKPWPGSIDKVSVDIWKYY